MGNNSTRIREEAERREAERIAIECELHEAEELREAERIAIEYEENEREAKAIEIMDLLERYEAEAVADEHAHLEAEMIRSKMGKALHKEMMHIMRLPIQRIERDDEIPHDIEDFKQALKLGEVSVSYGRVMFIGEAGAGKSTLLGALMNQPVAREAQSTIMAETKEVKYQWVVTKQDSHWCNVTEEDEMKELAVLTKKVRSLQGGKLLETNAKARAVKIFNPTEVVLSGLKQVPSGSFEQDAKQVVSEIITKAQELVDDDHTMYQKDQYINVWDCAGQRVFLDVLPAFLTSRTMFFLLFDASKDLESKVSVLWNQKGHCVQLESLNLSRKELLLQWMSCINTTLTKRAELFYKAQHSKCNEAIHLPLPRILIIGTHGDALTSQEKDVICSNLVSEWNEKTLSDQVTDTVILDCTKRGEETDPELNKVKSTVAKFISDALCIPTPIAWVLFRKLFTKLTTNRPVVPLSNVAIVSRVCSIEDTALCSVLAFYHELGAFLHYLDIESLRDVVIAQPKWLVKHLGNILAPEQAGNSTKGPNEAWRLLRTYGILTEVLYNEVLKTEFSDFEVKPQAFADLLEHFLLITEVHQISIKVPRNYGRTYFMPCVLPICPHDCMAAPSKAVLTAAPLHLIFSSQYVPPGFFVRLATIVGSTPGFTIDFTHGIYSNCIKFQYGDDGHNGRIDDIMISSTLCSIRVDISRQTNCTVVANNNFPSTCRSILKVFLSATSTLSKWFPSILVELGFTCECNGSAVHYTPMSIETESLTPLRCECSTLLHPTEDQQFWLKIPIITDQEGVLYADEIKGLLQKMRENDFVKLARALEMEQTGEDDRVSLMCQWSRQMGKLARSYLVYHLRRIGFRSLAQQCSTVYNHKHKDETENTSSLDEDHVNPLVTEAELDKCSDYIADDADLSVLGVLLNTPVDTSSDPKRRVLNMLMQWREQLKSQAYKEELIKIFTDCGKGFEKASRILNGDGAEVPTLKTLMSSVGDQCAPDWYRFGLELGILDYDLNVIQSDYNNKFQDAMRKTLQKWLEISTNPTWKQIVAALQRMKKDAIAKSIEEKEL